jgi:formyltetrahydrofolate hydrolase
MNESAASMIALLYGPDRPGIVYWIPHCLHDLIYRWQAGELKGALACIVSNHRDLEPLAEAARVRDHHVPVTRENRAAAHHATPELDQGSIIAQDLTRLNYRHTVADLIRKGRHWISIKTFPS